MGLGGGVGLGGVRVDVNEELKFFCENSKKNIGGGVGRGGGGSGGGGGGGGVRSGVGVGEVRGSKVWGVSW